MVGTFFATCAIIVYAFFFSRLFKNREGIWYLVFWFLTQNQLPQIIIEEILKICPIEALLVAIRTTLKTFEEVFSSVEKNQFKFYDFLC